MCMITEEMVETGARAICALTGDDPDQKTYAREMVCAGSDRGPKQRWEFWAPMTRAALTAAFHRLVVVPADPTDDMVEAGERARMEHTDIYFDGSEVARNPERAIYVAMVEASALSPQQGSTTNLHDPQGVISEPKGDSETLGRQPRNTEGTGR